MPPTSGVKIRGRHGGKPLDALLEKWKREREAREHGEPTPGAADIEDAERQRVLEDAERERVMRELHEDPDWGDQPAWRRVK